MGGSVAKIGMTRIGITIPIKVKARLTGEWFSIEKAGSNQRFLRWHVDP